MTYQYGRAPLKAAETTSWYKVAYFVRETRHSRVEQNREVGRPVGASDSVCGLGRH